MEKFRGEQKNVTRFRDFISILSVRLCSRFIAHESGSNSPGQGFDQNKVPAVEGFYLGFAYGKINIPAIPRPSGGRGDVVAKDWCITLTVAQVGYTFESLCPVTADNGVTT